jgi:3-deoxy-D-manno-octulosonate 8-phosphate phosphatase (KDO 8-P phosphatase)
MNFDLNLVSTIHRVEWIAERHPLESVIYMGDGIFDQYVMSKVGYGIAPANADKNAKVYASYITERFGGDRAVSEACLHILDKFFIAFNPELLPASDLKMSGEWTA